MCLNPVSIPNANKGLGHVGLFFMKETTASTILVPCGHCAECVAANQAQFVQRAEVESEYNHVFFATLTYDNKHLPSLDVYVPKENLKDLEFADRIANVYVSKENQALSGSDRAADIFSIAELEERESARVRSLIEEFESRSPDEDFSTSVPDAEVIPDPLSPNEYYCSMSSGLKKVNFSYADIHHVQLLMKNLRDNVDFDGRTWKYVCVSELGKTNGRPHFHILFFIQKRSSDFLPDGTVRPSVTSNLEKKLWDGCFKYWALNVGTRKNPVYEKLFTYSRKFYGNRVYTNFDLHYVDPQGKASSLLTGPGSAKLAEHGTKPVIYYVSKYMMKASEKEQKRQQFLRLNLDDEQYQAVWKIIKCRMTVSKGFGLNAHFTTEDVPIYVAKYVDYDLSERLALYNAYLADCDDLPVSFSEFSNTRSSVRRRVMHPDPSAIARVKKDTMREAGKKPHPIFVNYEGKHVPLAQYYAKRREILDEMDLMTLWFLTPADEIDKPRRCDMPIEMIEEVERKHAIKLKTMMQNSPFDTSPALLFPGDEGNTHNTISL